VVYQVNPHVERLHRYLPFDPLHDQIYEENRRPGESLEIETRALEYLDDVVSRPETRLVILTGDAGHGKTHLCSRVIRGHLGYDGETTRETIRERCDGQALEPASGVPSARKLRIFKDFSEPTVEAARRSLAAAMVDDDSVRIICVNEGRLRAILSSVDPKLVQLRRAFSDSFKSGLVSSDGKLHIVNLNYQSVAVPTNSILERVLMGEESQRGWLTEDAWAECDSCAAVAGCPIRRNRDMLLGPKGDVRRDGLREVMAIAERLGVVITIREILMTIAYLLTGGLRCEDVHRLHAASRGGRGWQFEYIFYNLLFHPPSTLGEDKLARIPLLKELRHLDAGSIADREIDEQLINDPDNFPDASFELFFDADPSGSIEPIDATNGIDEILADARNAQERQLEETFTRTVIRSLRRRDYFDNRKSGEVEARRLGIRHYDDFRWLLSGGGSNARKVQIKNQLISGLHTIQGLRLPKGEVPLLYLVDPAFGRSTNHAAIVARTISPVNIKLIPQAGGLAQSDDPNACRLVDTVDWIDRAVLLSVETPKGPNSYPMDLLTFDCIMRAQSGYMPANFYAHDIRRAMNFLSLVAENGGEVDHDKIDVMVGGTMKPVVLEEGDLISIGGALI
jgi:hypothetical protein